MIWGYGVVGWGYVMMQGIKEALQTLIVYSNNSKNADLKNSDLKQLVCSQKTNIHMLICLLIIWMINKLMQSQPYFFDSNVAQNRAKY